MARFRATIKGQRGSASRLGSATSGIVANVNGWNLGIQVVAMDDRAATMEGGKPGKDSDRFEVRATGGSNGSWSVPLFTIVQKSDGSIGVLTYDSETGQPHVGVLKL